MTPVVTEEQLKSLKLFSYYLQSHGIKRARIDFYLEYCQIDYASGYADGNDGSRAELYDAIEKTLTDIIDANNLADMNDCENRGTLTFRIDCEERELEVDVFETVYGSNEMLDSENINEIDDSNVKDSFDKLFSKMREEGKPSTTRVYFNGSGDSGDIDGHTQDGTALPSEVLHYFYSWLENFYGGWEINEGSQGRFDIDADEKTLFLDFQENTEEEQQRDIDFQIKF